jgi:hypothetical protein
MDARQRINNDRRRAFGKDGRLIAFVCECTDSSCHGGVLLTPEQYDARRPDAIVHPTHAAAALAPSLTSVPLAISPSPPDVGAAAALEHRASELGSTPTDPPAAPA